MRGGGQAREGEGEEDGGTNAGGRGCWQPREGKRKEEEEEEGADNLTLQQVRSSESEIDGGGDG